MTVNTQSVWWKILAAVLPVLAGAIVAFTRVQDSVHQIERALDTKADRGVVEANQQAILRELSQIQGKLDHLQRSR